MFQSFRKSSKSGFTPHHFCEKSGGGFTLVELLVVIAVITLLASIILASIISTTKGRGRDGKREADLRQISLVLGIYYQDKGYYPADVGGQFIPASVKNTLSPYLSPVPDDPLGSSSGYKWMDNTVDSQNYCIWTQYENKYNKTWLVASKAGVGVKSSAPACLSDCASPCVPDK